MLILSHKKEITLKSQKTGFFIAIISSFASPHRKHNLKKAVQYFLRFKKDLNPTNHTFTTPTKKALSVFDTQCFFAWIFFINLFN